MNSTVHANSTFMRRDKNIFLLSLRCLHIIQYVRPISARTTLCVMTKGKIYTSVTIMRGRPEPRVHTNVSNSRRINNTLDGFNKLSGRKTDFTEMRCKIRNGINKILLFGINLNDVKKKKLFANE